MRESNLQLLSPSNFSRLLPSPSNESSSSSSLHSAVPHLRELKLDQIVGSSSGWELLRHHTKLETISFYFCNDLTQVPESIRSLTSLQVLHIIGCPALGALPEWLGELCSLRDLEVSLFSLPDLEVSLAQRIRSLPRSIGQLTSLTKLQIGWCDNLKLLPDAIQIVTPSNLQLGE